MAARPKIVAFDIIGTTFSLEPVRAALIQLGFPANALEIWFARTLRDAFALAATNSFIPFRAIFDSNLDDLSLHHSIRVDKGQKEQLLGQFAALPPQPDAVEAFELIKSAGIPIFALTNGASASTEKLLQGANLRHLVTKLISVEDIGVFKPRPEIYHYAAQTAGVMSPEMALVASHAWDVHGAKNAGLMAAFVARGQEFPSTMKAPDVIGASLLDVARALAHTG